MSSTGISLRKRIGLEIQRKFQNDLIETHPLYQLFWECTLRCNLHCRHCGSDCKTDTRLKDMPGEDFLRVLDSVRAKQNPHEVFVIITGGEPLMRSDLEKWGRAIYDKGFPWGLVTNGRLLTAERFRSLLAAGLHSVAISLDGLKENTRRAASSYRPSGEPPRKAYSPSGLSPLTDSSVSDTMSSSTPPSRCITTRASLRSRRFPSKTESTSPPACRWYAPPRTTAPHSRWPDATKPTPCP